MSSFDEERYLKIRRSVGRCWQNSLDLIQSGKKERSELWQPVINLMNELVDGMHRPAYDRMVELGHSKGKLRG